MREEGAHFTKGGTLHEEGVLFMTRGYTFHKEGVYFFMKRGDQCQNGGSNLEGGGF